MKDKLKDGKWGEVQGEKEISLTGFLSCTTDSIEIGRREWKMGWRWHVGQRMERKRQTANAFHLTSNIKSKI